MKNSFENQIKRMACKFLKISFDKKLKIKDLATMLKEKYPDTEFKLCTGKSGYYLRRFTPHEPSSKQAMARLNFIERSSNLYGITGVASCEYKDGTHKVLTRLAAELSLKAKNGKVKGIIQTAQHQSGLTEQLQVEQKERVDIVMPMVEALE